MVTRNKRANKAKGVYYFSLGDGLPLVTMGDEPVIKKALVAVDGSFKDSDGTEHQFTADRLNTIAQHTNFALENGTTIPVCFDHDKSVTSTVGTIDGHAYTKQVTEADLPNPKATHLIGKIGLFIDNVVLKTQDAISKLNQGINSVSMGLNLDPSEHRLVELSLVSVPAIPNMGLFTYSRQANHARFSMDEDASTNAYTWEELEQENDSLSQLEEDYEHLTENLWRILTNIYTSDAIQITDFPLLRQYVYSALNGFSLRVLDLVGLSEQEQQMQQQDPYANAGYQDAAQSQQMAQTQYDDLTAPSTAAYSKGGLLTRFSKRY